MTQSETTSLTQERRAEYLLWDSDHGAYWGPNRGGYFTTIYAAGLYTRAEAEDIIHGASDKPIRMVHVREVEGSVRCIEKGLAGLLAALQSPPPAQEPAPVPLQELRERIAQDVIDSVFDLIERDDFNPDHARDIATVIRNGFARYQAAQAPTPTDRECEAIVVGEPCATHPHETIRATCPACQEESRKR